MLKYFKEVFKNYENAELLQSIAVVSFVVFFVSIILIVWLRPKNYYKEVSQAPLEEDNIIE